ncbi:hypothetical protein ASG35_08285 [Burkholderia sp. Leaf177]|uniref:hypothetical protein n=1 Tax=Burkholderia sp. Leaf177 TaxID=1736287 RepID=UPI0006F2AF20|nr:hypothetical protein [Burkholderia sp. Leaf177]KQR78434.1 hypothetical protein ASG35_08285 [Burkholderia sp. Leaf177]
MPQMTVLVGSIAGSQACRDVRVVLCMARMPARVESLHALIAKAQALPEKKLGCTILRTCPVFELAGGKQWCVS